MMSFLAGLISPKRPIDPTYRLKFLNAVAAVQKDVPWPMNTAQHERSLLAEASFPHLWEGPKLLSVQDFDAVASGVQCQAIPSAETALGYLTRTLASEPCKVGPFFDYFICALLDKDKDNALLAGDPLGIRPLLYMLHDSYVVFSTHQTFFRRFLGWEYVINWQAVFEYLVIGHTMGNKTLLKGVHALPAGCRFIYGQKTRRLSRYDSIAEPGVVQQISLEEATDLVFDHLMQKCNGYPRLTGRPFAGFLSGGWDSRLLAAVFARLKILRTTYTTQQQIRFGNRLISEKKIAREVARHLGVDNRFVAPLYRTPKTAKQRARLLDYTTWFHDWAFALVETLPYDEHIFCDGLLGDLLLRALYITPGLRRCIETQNRSGAARLLHRQYLKGFNTYTKGFPQWQAVLDSPLLNQFPERLLAQISEEIDDIPHQDFVTVFLIRNRSRMGIGPLPHLIFGAKATVIFPFCDGEFLHKSLSLPLEYRLDQSLYRSLLEKVEPGLSCIPSTNSNDLATLQPYLIDSRNLPPPESSPDPLRFGTAASGQASARANAPSSANRSTLWAQEIIDNPPTLFGGLLHRSLRKIIKEGDMEGIRPFRFFLEKIWVLENYFS
jgi:hypothetical protein